VSPLLAFSADALVLAWIVVVVGAVWLLGRGVRRHRGEVLALAGWWALAAAAYLALPWGPLDFAEAERLSPLWESEPFAPSAFGGGLVAPLVVLARAALPTLWLLRAAGPLLGGAGVGMTWLLARRAGLGRGASSLAAAVVLTWPAYAHHATSVGLTVAGAAVWTAAFALASERTVPAWGKLPLLAALVTIGVWTRPEYRLLGLALVPLLFVPGWSWRRRFLLALLLLPGLLAYHQAQAFLRAEIQPIQLTEGWLRWVLSGGPVNAPWWLLAGVAGLAAGRGLPLVRLAAGLAVALLGAVYWRFSSDANPLWGQWRSFVSLVPFVGVGVGALAERATEGRAWRRPALAALGALCAATLLRAWPTLRRPLDLQREGEYIRAQAPRFLATNPALLLFTARSGFGDSGVPPEASVLLAASTRIGSTQWPRRCDQGPRLPWAGPQILDLEDFALRCPGSIPANAVAYVGLFRPAERLAAVRRQVRLEPLDERRFRVAPSVPLLNTQCPVARLRLYGTALRDCEVTFGWYRVSPR